jgi:succinoglycan biosynthesis transport protein ExoP
MTKRERDISARFGEDHPQAVALRREEADVTRQIFGELKRLTESYRNEYEVAKSREASLRANVGELSDQSSKSGQSGVHLRDLEQKSQALATLYQTFLARYEEASQQRSFPIAQARVISQADNPVAASSPRKTMTLGLSMVLGLFAGAGVGALREFRERFFRTADDVQNALDVKFLGYLPTVGASFSGAKASPAGAGAGGQPQRPARETTIPRILRVAINSPSSSFAETLRNVKLAGDVVLQGNPCKVIGFVSVLPHEGKTTAAANFAGLLAANGSRTLLIDGDLRNPGLTRGLPLVPEKGLVEAVVGGEQRWQNTILVDKKTKLAILPAVVRGRLSHTGELISGAGMRDLIEAARHSFDYIIVDLPPLGPVVDAKAFAPLADGFVLVVEWGATPRALVRSALQAEPQIAAKTLGLVLNKTDIKKLPRYGLFGGAEQYLDRYASYYVDQSVTDSKAANPLEPA